VTSQPGQISLESAKMTGLPEHNSKVRTAGIGQSGQQQGSLSTYRLRDFSRKDFYHPDHNIIIKKMITPYAKKMLSSNQTITLM
jgi:hypothetical protein